MKTLFFLFIFSIIAVSQATIINSPTDNSKIVILKVQGEKPAPDLLDRSSGIISGRLNTYGLKYVSIKVLSDKNEIEVQFPDNINIPEIEGLLTSEGELSFYETVALNIDYGNFKKEFQNFDAKQGLFGCAGSEDPEMVRKAEEYLRSQNLSTGYRLMWGRNNEKSQSCLYSLKVNSDGKALMTRSDIENIKSDFEKVSKTLKIDIKFKQEATGKWAKATGDNIERSIAIAVDNNVFYTPVVKTVIKSGLCEITGNMTRNEVNYFLALVNNGNLPLKLVVAK